MKRILAITMLVLITLFACVGCGKDNINATEKQKIYEDIFNNFSKIEFNSNNIKATSSTDRIKEMDVRYNEDGDIKAKMYVLDSLGYIIYKIDGNTYIEIHTPEYQNDKGKTVAAEDVYYKSTGESQPINTDLNNSIIESLNLSKDNIVSVKYVDTEDIDGVKCDVVAVSHKATSETEEVLNNIETSIEKQNKEVNEDEDSDESINEDDGSDLAEQSTDIVNATFYFTTDTNKMYGYKSDFNDASIEYYFPSKVSIELPKNINFIDADEETVENKLLDFYTVVYSMIDISELNE